MTNHKNHKLIFFLNGNCLNFILILKFFSDYIIQFLHLHLILHQRLNIYCIHHHNEYRIWISRMISIMRCEIQLSDLKNNIAFNTFFRQCILAMATNYARKWFILSIL